MSRLQVAAKPVVLRLIHDFWLPLTSDEQSALASWAVMSTMVFESAHPKTATATFEQRVAFKDSDARLPVAPANWTIWIGRFDGIDSGAHNHAAWSIRVVGGDQEPPNDSAPLDHQVTGFVVGKLFILTYSAPDNFGDTRAVEAGAFALTNGLQVIWPSGQIYRARPGRVLNPLEWQVITRSIPAGYGIEPRYGVGTGY